MKKNENVILSNEIEIIDGIEIDWSKFKANYNGRTRKGYVGLCELLYKNGHTLESDYISNATKVDINFNCGHSVHSITPNHYKNGRGCPECKREKIIEINKRSLKIAKEEFFELAKRNGHIILGEYVGNKTKILIDFNCEHKPHSVTPTHYKQGYGCPECSVNSSEKSKKELYELAKKNGHTILGEYINSKTKILIDFNCEHKPHLITPYNYKSGQGCPICKSSKGEAEVTRILKEVDIEYQEQYRFEDCRCVNPLPFDFYIPEFNICIEYDGEFHYKAIRFRKENETEYDIALARKIAEERLKEVQRRDKIKTDYCKENGINLIRIPYWEFDNIESILKKELSKYIKAVA